MDPYTVLGIKRNAEEETIKKAFKQMARQWHPDLFHTAEEKAIAEEKMKEINAAYEAISTPEKRAAFAAENPESVNVYEYYANKKTTSKKHKTRSKDSADIENEKQRKAVLKFLEVEYEHKQEIFDMFAELATGAVNDAFSAEEYLELLELVLQEQQTCIANIQNIIAVAKQKHIQGLEFNFAQAQEAIDELIEKGNEAPKSLKQAHYIEETRLLTEKIHDLMSGFRDRILTLSEFHILNKTWEFDNDEELTLTLQKHQSDVNSLLADMHWIEKTAHERQIEIGLIDLSDNSSSYRYEKTLDECKQIVYEKKVLLNLNLQQLREEFWRIRCTYSTNSAGQTILQTVHHWNAEYCYGNFICPPNISGISERALRGLTNITSISIPIHLINSNTQIRLPKGKLKKVIFTFPTHSQIVDVSCLNNQYIIERENNDYISVSSSDYTYSWDVWPGYPFILIDNNGIYVYDEKKLYSLCGVKTREELTELSDLWGSYSTWKGFKLQIHTWAQVTQKLPSPYLMQLLPVSVESVRKWVNMDKTNFDTVLLKTGKDLQERVIFLYLALGALNGNECHAQAEYLISQLDVNTMYRSRLERHPKEKSDTNNQIFSVPKSAVDLVEQNIHNKEFCRYVLAFLEGYKLFRSEAKKCGVELSADFIMATAPQYIFHKKAITVKAFAKQLLELEQDINPGIADRILNIHTLSQNQLESGIKKNIIETVDMSNSSAMHYTYLDIQSIETYLAFQQEFRAPEKWRRQAFYRVEAENVFLSSNSHAIEIVDGENKRIAIVILNLFDKGELFADIMYCNNKNMDVIETIRRAIIDQKNCNTMVTGISIGMNEAPTTSRYNEWRNIIQNSSADWKHAVEWHKFQYLFKSSKPSNSYKAYRAKFMVEGKSQYLDYPDSYISKKRARRRRMQGW